MTIDRFLRLPGTWSNSVTILSMVLVLVIFGYTAFRFMLRSKHLFASLLSALWASMFSILVLFIYSWIMTFLFMPWIEKILIEDPGLPDQRDDQHQ